MLTIAQTITVGDISTYKSLNYRGRKQLFGGMLSPITPESIAMVTDALRWGKDGGAQTAISLRSTANYLLWMCQQFQLNAQAVMSGSGGGSVVPGGGGGVGQYYVINTEAVSSDPTDGSPTIGSFAYQNDLLIGATQLYYIIVNNTMETIAMGDFTFDNTSGLIIRVNSWQDGDKVQIPFLMA